MSKPYKIVIRLPQSMRNDLIREAKHEGVSINTYISYKLMSPKIDEHDVFCGAEYICAECEEALEMMAIGNKIYVNPHECKPEIMIIEEEKNEL